MVKFGSIGIGYLRNFAQGLNLGVAGFGMKALRLNTRYSFPFFCIFAELRSNKDVRGLLSWPVLIKMRFRAFVMVCPSGARPSLTPGKGWENAVQPFLVRIENEGYSSEYENVYRLVLSVRTSAIVQVASGKSGSASR